MKKLDKTVFILCIALLFIPFLLGCTPAVAGVGDFFWNITYWVGDTLSKNSAGQFIEKGFDGILGFFNIHLGEHVTPDYWGALTGTYSGDMGFKISMDNVDHSCSLRNPMMHRDSVDSPWQLDSIAESLLRECGEVLRQKLPAMGGKQ